MNSTDYASTLDLCSRWQTHPATISSWIKAGFLPKPSRRLGNSNLWLWSDVEMAEEEAIASGKTRGLAFAAAQFRNGRKSASC